MDSLAARNAKARTNNWLSGALIVALLLGAVWMGFEEALPSSGPVPSFSWEKLEGGRVSSDELRGKVVMLDFWATWCGPCKVKMPWLIKLADEYASKGVVFVAADCDDAEVQKEAVERFVGQMPALKPHVAFTSPEEAHTRFNVRAYPTLFVIDRQGQLVASGVNTEREARMYLDEALARTP